MNAITTFIAPTDYERLGRLSGFRSQERRVSILVAGLQISQTFPDPGMESELLRGVHQLMLASTGLWSLPLAGGTQELSGSTPLTRTYVILKLVTSC